VVVPGGSSQTPSLCERMLLKPRYEWHSDGALGFEELQAINIALLRSEETPKTFARGP
jgi:hypothetical protein